MADEDPLSWLLELDAKLDGAKEMLEALKANEDGLKSLDKALKSTDDATRHTSEGHEKHAKHARTLSHELEQLNNKLKDLTAFQVFEFGFDKALDLAHELVKVVAEIGSEIINTAAHEERLQKSFKLQLGDEQGGEVLEYLERLGKQTEFVSSETKAYGQDLVKAGFAAKDLPYAFAAIADLAGQSADRTAGATAALTALERIQRSGKIEERSLRGVGIGEDQLIDVIRRRGNKGSAEQIKKALSDGKLDRSELLQSLYQTITEKTGKQLGGVGEDLSNGLEARLRRLKSLPELYFEKWANSPSFKVFSDRIDALFKRLDPSSPEGAKVLAELQKVLDTLTGAFEDFLTPEGIGNFIDGIKTTVSAIGELAKGLREIVNLLNGETISKALRSGDNAGDSKVRELEEMRQLGYADNDDIAQIVDTMTASEKDDLARLGKKVGFDYAHFTKKANFAPPNPIANTGNEPPIDIAGLDSLDARSSAKEAGKALGKAHEDGVREELDMHSPSRRLEALGRLAADSFAMGIDAASDDVGDAFDFEAPSVGGSGASAGAAFGGGRSATISIPLYVTVEGAMGDNAEALAKRVVELAPTALQAAIEQLRAELGA